MHTHPTIPLQKLLKSRPVNYPLDKYQQPWREIFTALQSAPAKPQVRQAALKAAVGALPQAALDRLEDSITDPLALARHLHFQHPRIRLLRAVVDVAPVQVYDLACHLKRDRSNTFRSLQGLVSLGLLTRYKENNKVYYSLPDPLPLPVASLSQPEE